MPSVKFWLLDINDEVVDEKPEIRLWGLDDKGCRTLIIDRSFLQYFYLLLEDDAKPEDVLKEIESRKASTPGIAVLRVVDKKYFGKPVRVIRVACRNPTLVTKYASSLGRVSGVRDHLEDDIRYSSRYLIDKGINPCGWHEIEVEEVENEIGAEVEKVYLATSTPRAVDSAETPRLRVLAFSMVCHSARGSPKPEKDPIVIISSAANDGSQRQFIAEDHDDRRIIKSFIKHIHDSDPDIIVGYGSNKQDWPYLMERAKKLGIKLLVDRSGSEPHTSLYGHVSVTGRSNIDLADFAEEIREVKVKTLENVADYLGVMRKEKRTKIEEIDISSFWDNDKKRPVLQRYAVENSKSILGISNITLDFAMQLSNLIGLPLDHVGAAAVGFRVEWYLISRAHEIGELVPKRTERPYFPYKGATVLRPKPGIHEKVAVLDFSSMYPNIMIANNISPDTYVKPGEAEPPCGVNTAPEVKHKFRKEPPGFYKQVLSNLIGARDEIKAKLKKLSPESPQYKVLNARELAVKTVTNACLDRDTPVITRRNRKISVVQIGELVDGMIEAGNPVIHEGFSDFVKPKGDFEVPSFNPDSFEVDWKPIVQGVRHRLNQQMLKIELKSGISIRVTPEHKMYALNGNGKIVAKRAERLHYGEWLPVLSRAPTMENGPTRLNLLRGFTEVEPERTEHVKIIIRHPYGKRVRANFRAWHRILTALGNKKSLSIKEVATHAGYRGPRYVSKHLTDLKKMGFVDRVPYKGMERKKPHKITPTGKALRDVIANILEKIHCQLGQYSYVWFNDIRGVAGNIPENLVKNWSLKLYNSSDRIPAIITISNEFSRLLGYYVAEGTSNEYKNRTRGTSRRITWYSHNSRIRSDIVRCFKKVFGFHLGIRPGSITSNSSLVYIIFISVLKSGKNAYEKSVPNVIINGSTQEKIEFLRAYDLGDGNRTLPYVRWTTVSPKLCRELVLLTKQLGVRGISIRKEKHVFRILIHDSMPFRKRAKIGHPMHQSFIIPREVVLGLMKNIESGYEYLRWSDSNVSASLARRLLTSTDGGSVRRRQRVDNLLEGWLHFEQIVHIHKVKQKGPYVYDVTVESPHTLFAGMGFIGISNCYGYAGWVGARWYIRPVAEATAAWGRHAIEHTIDLAKKSGLNIIYGDTDSVFVEYEAEGIKKFLEAVKDEVGLEIKPDKVYEPVLFTEAKKRYAGLLPDGRLDIVGLEVARGDWTESAKKVQTEVIEIILKEKSVDDAVKFVHQYIKNLKSKKVPYPDLVIWKTLTKPIEEYKVNAPHVTAAKTLKKLGWDLAPGEKIGYVIEAGEGKLYERATPYSLTTYDQLDLKYYEEKQIIPAALRVLSIFGKDKEDLKPEHAAQRTL